MAKINLPEIGSGWRRIKSGHRYTVTAIYGTWPNKTIELTPRPGERARKTWLSTTGFVSKFEPNPTTPTTSETT